MPANSSRFNRFLGLLLSQFVTVSAAFGEIFELSHSDLQWLGDRVFANECAGKFECLSSWNEGENFPSLGIGHFIWFPPGLDSPFEESFPGLLRFYREQGVKLPAWVEADTHPDAPWHSREDFYGEFDSERTRELRTFLATTKAVQVDFIVHRLTESLDAIIMSFPSQEQTIIREKLSSIARSHAPYGAYAIIDYVHFKGTGLATGERYQDQGWGLKHVLTEMHGRPTTLYSFAQSAKKVLSRRVANAPASRNEQRWLAGWHKRVETYLPPQ